MVDLMSCLELNFQQYSIKIYGGIIKEVFHWYFENFMFNCFSVRIFGISKTNFTDFSASKINDFAIVAIWFESGW